MSLKKIYFLLGCMLLVFPVFSQPVKTTIDKSNILIGQQIQYRVKIDLATSGYMVDFDIPDSIPHFEILDRKQYDTVEKGGGYSLIQSLVVTSFDSGSWVIPSFPVTVSSANKVPMQFRTDSLAIEVGYSPSDSTGLRDIKSVMDVHIPDYTWLYIIAAVLLLILLSWLIYRYFKNRKKKEKPTFIPSLKPYDEAIKALKALAKKEVVTPGDTRDYYTSLALIFKKYYSNKERKEMLYYTTGDALVSLRANNIEPGTISSLAEVLRISDAVKFAKYIPPAYENEAVITQMKGVIDNLEKKYTTK